MNGNFARSILCSLVTSVDLGWYSSIVGVCCFCGDWPCCVIAARGQTRNAAEAATRIVETKKMVRREFIVPLWTFELPDYLRTGKQAGAAESSLVSALFHSFHAQKVMHIEFLVPSALRARLQACCA